MLDRRGFIASAASGGALLSSVEPWSGARLSRTRSNDAGERVKAIDFSRSYLHCSPRPGAIWVRIQVECRCEVFDRATGRSDEYLLGVKAQTGLHKEPAVDPGYDFWVIFSKKYVYNKRVHASSYNNNPDRVPVGDYGPVGWHLRQTEAKPIGSVAEFRKALEAGQPMTARSVFASADGSRGFAIEYPIKWADVNLRREGFRVETGPVILLGPDAVRGGRDLEFEDFQWAHLDYHSFDSVRCILERPTPILEHAASTRPTSTPSGNPGLTPQQVGKIRNRLFSGWTPPISASALQRLFQTNHYSVAVNRPVKTTIYALE